MKKTKATKEGRIVGAANAASAGGSVIGAHNVCHAICLAAVALLSVIGVTISSNALMFLQDFALPFWIMGIAFLSIGVFLYMRFCCISKKLLLFNAGLLVIGMPFVQTLSYVWIFWLIGAAIAGYAALWYFSEKYNWSVKKMRCHEKYAHLNSKQRFRGVLKMRLNKENLAIYGVLAVAIAVLLFSVFSMINPVKPAQNLQYQSQAVDACGDLNDLANIQHLSHHPEQYKNCIKKVEPSLFKQAVGEDLDSFLSKNNIG